VICGAGRHYTLYHRGDTVRFAGSIPGAAGTFKVRVKIKRCIRGSFVTRFETHARGHNGNFSGSFLAPGRGFYSVRAYYNGQKSTKKYLKVT
jgi:hypothetical protein